MTHDPRKHLPIERPESQPGDGAAPFIVAALFLLALYWIPRILNAPSPYSFGT